MCLSVWLNNPINPDPISMLKTIFLRMYWVFLLWKLWLTVVTMSQLPRLKSVENLIVYFMSEQFLLSVTNSKLSPVQLNFLISDNREHKSSKFSTFSRVKYIWMKSADADPEWPYCYCTNQLATLSATVLVQSSSHIKQHFSSASEPGRFVPITVAFQKQNYINIPSHSCTSALRINVSEPQ